MQKIKTYTCIIPVRFASSRFPGKPLAQINGKSMVQHVYENAQKSKFLKDVLVATDSQKIMKHCQNLSMKVILTPKFSNGSERVAFVAKKLSDSYIFEMQGDQPLVTPRIIDDFLERADMLIRKNSKIDVVHPYTKCTDEQTESIDVLKVVVGADDRLLFQTRQPIKTGYRTLGLYVWKKQALEKFASLPISHIERVEDSHPIRLYVNHFFVQGVPISGKDWIEVDRPHQIKDVERLLRKHLFTI